jgi:uroporphyrinogen-III synthase
MRFLYDGRAAVRSQVCHPRWSRAVAPATVHVVVDARRPCWVVTRTADDGASLVDELRARGLVARALPCIAREALSWPSTLSPSSSGRTVVVCTSAFAARCVLEHARDAGWMLDGTGVQLAALSPSTAAVVSHAGIAPQIVCTGGSEALASAIVDDAARAPIARVLYPTSDAGLDMPEQARALARLAVVCDDVRRAAVYTTRPPADLRAAVAALPARIGLVFFSPSAVDAFVDVAAAEQVRDARVVCTGASTLRAWRARTTTPAELVRDGDDVVDTLLTLTVTKDPDEVRS